jgi:hypothetical protein
MVGHCQLIKLHMFWVAKLPNHSQIQQRYKETLLPIRKPDASCDPFFLNVSSSIRAPAGLKGSARIQ